MPGCAVSLDVSINVSMQRGNSASWSVIIVLSSEVWSGLLLFGDMRSNMRLLAHLLYLQSSALKIKDARS